MSSICRVSLAFLSLTGLALAAPSTTSFAGSTPLLPPPQRYVLESGHGTYAQAPPSTLLDVGAQFSLECWAFLESSNGSLVLMGRAQLNLSAFDYKLEVDAGSVSFSVTAGPSDQQRSSGAVTLPLRTWIHVAGVSDGQMLRLYVNGQQASQAGGAAVPTSTSPFLVDSTQFGSNVVAIRQARLWNRVLSPSDLENVARRSRVSGAEGLVAEWSLDDGEGQVARDDGPNGLNLQLGQTADNDGNDPRWVHTAVLDAGPFFEFQGLRTAASVGEGHSIGQAALIDFNSDGAPDVIISTSGSDPNLPTPLVILQNDGHGRFSDANTSAFSGAPPTGFGANGFAVADFDGDGREDVFVAVSGEHRTPFWGGQSLLLLQTPGGQMRDATTTNLPQLTDYAYLAKAADIDGSGHQSLYVDYIHFGQVNAPYGPLFYDNDGSARFTLDQNRLPPEFLEPNGTESGIFNAAAFVNARQKSVPDLVVCCNTGQPTLNSRDTLLLNDGSGHFADAPSSAMPVSGIPFATTEIAVADFDGDGWEDLVEAGCGPENPDTGDCALRLLLNNRDGSFRYSDSIPQKGNEIVSHFRFNKIRVADFNGDGHPDFLLESDPPQLFLNRGNGIFFNASDALPIDLCCAISYLVGNLDHSGRTSIVSAGDFGNMFSSTLNLKPFDLSLWDARADLPLLAPVPVPLKPIGKH